MNNDWAYPSNYDYWFEALLKWVEDNKGYVEWWCGLYQHKI